MHCFHFMDITVMINHNLTAGLAFASALALDFVGGGHGGGALTLFLPRCQVIPSYRQGLMQASGPIVRKGKWQVFPA